jgi:Tfp pilus assembly protein PilN
MIRINLLGTTRARGKKRGGAQVSAPSEGPSTMILVLVAVIIVGAGIWGAQWWVNQQHDRLEADLQRALQENQRLAVVKAKYEESKKKADLFDRRVKVIDSLKEAQKGPVDLLNLVASTVNKTDAIWLDTMTDDGKNLDFTGMALSPNAVADLMANLRKTGAFKSVEIKETAQDANAKELQTFKFELICEKAALGKVQKQS